MAKSVISFTHSCLHDSIQCNETGLVFFSAFLKKIDLFVFLVKISRL